MLIDTHTHLFLEEFDNDRDQVIQRAIESGVEVFLLPNIDVQTIESMHALSKKYPNNCFPMMGLHPGSVDTSWKANLDIIKEKLFSGNYIAVGEIGMDLYWDKTNVVAQREVFSVQVEWAKELNLPIVIHSRDAYEEIYKILDKLNDANLSGVFHCFTGTEKDAEKILSYGNFKLGIGGVLTYKNARIDESLKNVGLEQIVLETDSPYLTPVPFRGKRNESAYMVHVAERLANVYGVSVSRVEEVTTKNARELFQLKA
jgi:TatD DNase family protein